MRDIPGSLPEFVMPDQFFAPAVPQHGGWARALLRAILDHALQEERVLRRMEGKRAARMRHDVRAWFLSDSQAWGSFAFICAHLDIDHAAAAKVLQTAWNQIDARAL